MKLEVVRGTLEKTWEAEQHVTKPLMGHEEIKNSLRHMKMETLQNLWDTAKAFLRGKFIATEAYLPQETRKISNNLA